MKTQLSIDVVLNFPIILPAPRHPFDRVPGQRGAVRCGCSAIAAQRRARQIAQILLSPKAAAAPRRCPHRAAPCTPHPLLRALHPREGPKHQLTQFLPHPDLFPVFTGNKLPNSKGGRCCEGRAAEQGRSSAGHCPAPGARGARANSPGSEQAEANLPASRQSPPLGCSKHPPSPQRLS